MSMFHVLLLNEKIKWVYIYFFLGGGGGDDTKTSGTTGKSSYRTVAVPYENESLLTLKTTNTTTTNFIN